MTSDNSSEPRIYLVYEDRSYPGHSDSGPGVYVIAKNRKEALKKSGIKATHVKWESGLRVKNNLVVDFWGKIHGELGVIF
jgi:hypothetical protein